MEKCKYCGKTAQIKIVWSNGICTNEIFTCKKCRKNAPPKNQLRQAHGFEIKLKDGEK